MEVKAYFLSFSIYNLNIMEIKTVFNYWRN